jgi:hypothetical protein
MGTPAAVLICAINSLSVLGFSEKIVGSRTLCRAHQAAGGPHLVKYSMGCAASDRNVVRQLLQPAHYGRFGKVMVLCSWR